MNKIEQQRRLRIAEQVLHYAHTKPLLRHDIDCAVGVAVNAFDKGKTGATCYELGRKQIDMLAAGREIKTTAFILA